MQFKSYLNEVIRALTRSKKDICEEIGTLGESEAKLRAAVLTGNMKNSVTHEVMSGSKGVSIGTTMEAKYAVNVEKGIGQAPQPFLEPAIMDNIKKFEEIAGHKLSVNMGGK